MLEYLWKIWNWTSGVGVPTTAGLVSFFLAFWIRAQLTTYLPTTANIVSTGFLIAGGALIGYGQGRDTERDRQQERSLVAQANVLKESIAKLQDGIVVAANMQQRMAQFTYEQQQFAQQQQGQTNDLVAQLRSIPVPANCDYTPDVRKRLLNIHIRRPASKGSGRANPAR